MTTTTDGGETYALSLLSPSSSSLITAFDIVRYDDGNDDDYGGDEVGIVRDCHTGEVDKGVECDEFQNRILESDRSSKSESESRGER